MSILDKLVEHAASARGGHVHTADCQCLKVKGLRYFLSGQATKSDHQKAGKEADMAAKMHKGIADHLASKAKDATGDEKAFLETNAATHSSKAAHNSAKAMHHNSMAKQIEAAANGNHDEAAAHETDAKNHLEEAYKHQSY